MSFSALSPMPLGLPAPGGSSFFGGPLRSWKVRYLWTCSIDGSSGSNVLSVPARSEAQAMERARGVIASAERVLGRVAYRISLEVLG